MTDEEFIRIHRNDDVHRLALTARRDSCDNMTAALTQIAALQTAERKIPSWAATQGITWGATTAMEQCSSEATARYKAALVRRLTRERRLTSRVTLVDLTGGLGVDFSFMARETHSATYVERDARLCSIAEANFRALGIDETSVVCATAEQYLATMKPCTIAYMDPSRRTAGGRRAYAIADCSPDAAALAPLLRQKADIAIVKLSPMLDIHKAAKDMGEGVSEVHIVEADGECKELLLLLRRDATAQQRIVCARCSPQQHNILATIEPETRNEEAPTASPSGKKYLYEPSPSLMKAACFAHIARRYGAAMVAANSHLFVADAPIEGFPGRAFRIRSVVAMAKKERKTALAGIAKANIAVRNFPLSAEALRRILSLDDGGDTYIFGTTTASGRHILIVAERQ